MTRGAAAETLNGPRRCVIAFVQGTPPRGGGPMIDTSGEEFMRGIWGSVVLLVGIGLACACSRRPSEPAPGPGPDALMGTVSLLSCP